jgi:hypothetical protein
LLRASCELARRTTPLLYGSVVKTWLNKALAPAFSAGFAAMKLKITKPLHQHK